MLKEFANKQLEQSARKNILFCMIQSPAAAEGSLNNPLYKLQEALIQAEENGDAVQKAFVYGDKMIYTRPFGTAPVQKIFYADSTVRYVDAVHLLVIASAMMEKQAKAEPEADNILVIMLEEPLKAYEIKRFIAAQEANELACTLVLMEKEENGDTFEKYILDHQGMIGTFDRAGKICAWLRS